MCASSPHATGEGCPLPKQPGQDHLDAPGTCPKKVDLKLVYNMNDCKFKLMSMFVLFVMLADLFPTSVPFVKNFVEEARNVWKLIYFSCEY